jgi:ketosteroid isomerase-like protein
MIALASPGRLSSSPLLVALVALSLSACVSARPVATIHLEAEVARVLDDWHDAAAHADEARYFGHLAEGAVFLGTDMTERWDKEAFRAYAHRPFAKGKGWAFHAAERHVHVDADGGVAWFDERLDTDGLGPARGSGVLVRASGGTWQIAQYDLSVPIPNEKFDAVKGLIAR